MAKPDTVLAIQEKFKREALNPDAFTAKKLDALLACETPEAYDALLANLLDGDPNNDPPETQGEDPQTSDTPADQAGVSASPSQETTVTQTSTPNAAPEVEQTETIKVRINFEDAKLNLAEGTSYLHPVTKQLIYGDGFFSVPDDGFTEELLAGRYLTTKARK